MLIKDWRMQRGQLWTLIGLRYLLSSHPAQSQYLRALIDSILQFLNDGWHTVIVKRQWLFSQLSTEPSNSYIIASKFSGSQAIHAQRKRQSEYILSVVMSDKTMYVQIQCKR